MRLWLTIVCALLAVAVLVFVELSGPHAEERKIPSMEQLEIVTDLELFQDFDLIENLDVIEDLEVIEGLEEG